MFAALLLSCNGVLTVSAFLYFTTGKDFRLTWQKSSCAQEIHSCSPQGRVTSVRIWESCVADDDEGPAGRENRDCKSSSPVWVRSMHSDQNTIVSEQQKDIT